MDWNSLQINDQVTDTGRPRHEQIAAALATLIRTHQVRDGERMPTARQLSRMFSVSATTVSSAFELLTRQGLIRAEVGRGTFVSLPSLSATQPPFDGYRPHAGRQASQVRIAWRRSVLMSLSSRLRTTYPDAIECSTGRPDPSLFPFNIVRDAWRSAVENITPRDLQYAGPEPLSGLATQLASRLNDDGIDARAADILICSSAQQVFTMMFTVLQDEARRDPLLLGVEEPGYPTMLDTFERRGARMVGLAMDEHGVTPSSLEFAISSGAHAVLFTPRGQNPTGSSWSPERRSELADVLAAHPQVLIFEDDQVAEVATTRPGSLLNDLRLEGRVIYIRSFSKSIAPDLRVAAVAARKPLLDKLTECKSFEDGWTSRLLQRTLADILADERLEATLTQAKLAYQDRRTQVAEVINELLNPVGGGTWCGPDGVNLWLNLPHGIDARDAVERSAAAGVRIADGEAFFLSPGHREAVRLNAGSVPAEVARHAGKMVATAILQALNIRPGPIHV